MYLARCMTLRGMQETKLCTPAELLSQVTVTKAIRPEAIRHSYQKEAWLLSGKK